MRFNWKTEGKKTKTKTKKWKEMNRKNEGKEKRNVMGWRKTKKDINGNDFQGEKERFKERYKERGNENVWVECLLEKREKCK